MTAAEAQHLVHLSLKKILASRSRRGGIDIHRNLLLASVLLKARDACIARTYDPRHYDDTGNQDEAETSVANDDERHADVSNSRREDVTLTSDDDVPNCDEETTSERECAEGAQGVRGWDVIPDQALEEWNFLGPDICGEQLESEETNQPKSDLKRHAGEEVEDFPAADSDIHRVNSISRKRTIDNELDVGNSAHETDRSVFLPHKKQRTDRSVNCENICMDFDDLIDSLEDECSIGTTENDDTSKDLVDRLAFSLEFPITCSDSSIHMVNDTSTLLSCHQSTPVFSTHR